jgi:hypothetical protein
VRHQVSVEAQGHEHGRQTLVQITLPARYGGPRGDSPKRAAAGRSFAIA